MTDPSSFAETGIIGEQYFDRDQFQRLLSLRHSFFDPMLDVLGKEQVVHSVEQNDGTLLQGLLGSGPTGVIDRSQAVDFLSNLIAPNENIPALQELGYSFIERHLPQLELLAISASDFRQSKEIVDLMLRLNEVGDNDRNKSLVSSLQNILKKELTTIPETGPSIAEDEAYQVYLDSFQAIFRLGTEDQIVDTARLLASTFDDASTPELKAQAGRVITHALWTDEPDNHGNSNKLQSRATWEIADYVLSYYGLDYSTLSWIWGNYADNDSVFNETIRNMDSILLLETKRPGIAKVLHEEFKIRFFMRYPKEVLITQYDHRDDTELPYGVMFSSLADHNSAFGNIGLSWFAGSIFQELRDVGCLLRVYEGGTTEELRASLEHASDKYGAKTARFCVICGHGSPNSVELNWKHPRHLNRELRKESLADNPGQFTKFMRGDAVLILVSCWTGAEGGIAQEISKQGITAIGPNQEAGIGFVRVEKKLDGALDIRVNYRGTKTNKYRDGQLITA